MNLPITMIEPAPITVEEIDAALGDAPANDAGVSHAPRLMTFTPEQLDELLDVVRAQERHRLGVATGVAGVALPDGAKE